MSTYVIFSNTWNWIVCINFLSIFRYFKKKKMLTYWDSIYLVNEWSHMYNKMLMHTCMIQRKIQGAKTVNAHGRVGRTIKNTENFSILKRKIFWWPSKMAWFKQNLDLPGNEPCHNSTDIMNADPCNGILIPEEHKPWKHCSSKN